MRLAYADPPYPGKAHLYEENREVNHRALFKRLAKYDGWALSTMSSTLARVLSVAPQEVCVAAWVRTNAPPFNAERRGAVRSWEPVVFMPARTPRDEQGRVRDVFYGEAPSGFRQQGGLTGTKPRGFGEWLFRLLGAELGDALDDLFPGSGVVMEGWELASCQLAIV